jgi:hypothetical protein
VTQNLYYRLLFTALLLVILLGLFSVVGYYQLFGTFSEWDDEGYLMLSIHRYVNQGRILYDEVYSQYGPFYYLFHWFLHGSLLAPLSSDGIRWVFLGFWLALILVCFRLVSYLTASPVSAFLACIPFGWMLRKLAAEPAHPQGLVVVLIAFVLVSSSLLKWTGPWRSFVFVLLGVGTAALILVKPNIGGYLLFSVLWAMLAMTPNSRWTLASRYLLAVACFFLPAVLMASRLTEHWAQKYALLTMATLTPILLLLVRPPRHAEIRARDWGVFAASAFSAAGAIVAAVMIGGTSLQKLILVLLLEPLRFASVFFIPLNLARGAFAWAAFSLLLFGVYLLVDRLKIDFSVGQRVFSHSTERTFKVPIDALLLGFFGLTTMYYAYSARHYDVWERASPFLWVALIPCRSTQGEVSAGYFVRVLLVVTAAFQILHAYPVAGGSQVTWSLMWMVPVAMVCLHDACSTLFPWPPSLSQPRLSTFRKVAALALVVAAIVLSVQRGRALMEIYRSLEPLNLPGALRVRTHWLSAETYRWLTGNLNAHADTFVSIPGLDSFYRWTGKESPGMLSGGFWMMMFTDEQQEKTITQLSRFPNVAAIRNRRLIEVWSREDMSNRPLVAYIDRHFKTIGRVGDYEFMVHEDRKPVALNTDPLLSFAMMQLPGIFIRKKPRMAIVDGVNVLLSSSDNEIRFKWPMDTHSVTGVYGLYPEVCGEDNGRPVRVTIEKSTPQSKVLLFERTLNPQTADDRGMHRFEVSVPALEDGVLKLMTKALGSPAVDDCVYWVDITIN